MNIGPENLILSSLLFLIVPLVSMHTIPGIYLDEFIQRNQEIKPYATLNELLGHTPLEVFCGMILGIAVPFIIHNIKYILHI